jgi:hypothetical protein
MNCNAPWVVHIIVGHHHKFMVGIVTIVQTEHGSRLIVKVINFDVLIVGCFVGVGVKMIGSLLMQPSTRNSFKCN